MHTIFSHLNYGNSPDTIIVFKMKLCYFAQVMYDIITCYYLFAQVMYDIITCYYLVV